MATSPTDILTSLQHLVIAFNGLSQALNTVSTTSSGTLTIRITNGSSI